MHQMVCGNHTFQAKQTHLDLPQDFVDQGPFFELVLNIFWMPCVFVLCVFVQAFQSVISMRSEQAFGEDDGHHFSALWISLLCFCHRFISSLNIFGCFFSLMFTAFEQEQGQGLSIKKHMEQISSAYGLRKTLNCCMTPNRAGTVWLHSWIYKKITATSNETTQVHGWFPDGLVVAWQVHAFPYTTCDDKQMNIALIIIACVSVDLSGG